MGLPVDPAQPQKPGMNNRNPKKDQEKKPREERVMEHAAETENGGFPAQTEGAGRAATPEHTRGGEPPRPVGPPQEPGVGSRSHR
jgi:hypothetical protein